MRCARQWVAETGVRPTITTLSSRLQLAPNAHYSALRPLANLALTVFLADNERNMKDTPVTPSSPASTEPKVAAAQSAAKATFWGVFLSTFVTIFLAELGDKTQVATLLISAESHKPLTVFIGAAFALISTSLVGVLVGQWLARRISPETLDTLAGFLLLIISVGLVADVISH